jgi:holo-[acyl-carrier protein] synthase
MMILGIGIDLISIKRIEELKDQFKEKFLQRIFTENEIKEGSLKSSPEIFFAKRFAAKEAFAKALGLGLGRGVNFSDIEVFNDEFGKPFLRILNNKKDFVLRHFSCDDFVIHLSLSDENSLANAIVIIEGKSK